MFGKKKADVVIVGAGPVGLFAAVLLAQRGIKVEVFDKDWRTAAHSYALVLHPGALCLLHKAGLAEKFSEAGHKVERVHFMEGQDDRAVADLTRLSGRYPYSVVLPQSQLESELENLLGQQKIKVHWDHRVEDVTDQGDHVDLRISRLEKEPLGYPIAHMESVVAKTIDMQCSFVIGADGYHSLVRRRLGMPIQSLGDPLHFSVFEFETGSDWGRESRIGLTEEFINVFWPMRSGRCRLSFQVREASDERPELDDLRGFMDERAPWFEGMPDELSWSSPVTFERRLSKSFGQGRIWLAGDAAHLAEPMAAQSMNVGLREAYDLAMSMANILEGSAKLHTLEDYDKERQREWRSLLVRDESVETRKDTTPWVETNRSRIVPSLPASGDELDQLLRQIGLGFAQGSLGVSVSGESPC